jgi:hypothetical protein
MIREKIIDCINKSTDEKLHPIDKRFIETIHYGDVMDIVFFYLSLYLKDRGINRMKTSNFYNMSEAIWNKWSREKKNKKLSHLCGAYCAGPGPMGGTASSAEMYFRYYTKFTFFENIQEFFNCSKGTHCGWSHYRDNQVIPRTLPKWRRANNFKKINQVFELAETICRGTENYEVEK